MVAGLPRCCLTSPSLPIKSGLRSRSANDGSSTLIGAKWSSHAPKSSNRRLRRVLPPRGAAGEADRVAAAAPEFLTGFNKPLRGETERRLLSQARRHESGEATMAANMRISISHRSRAIRRDWSPSISLRRFMRKHSLLPLPWQEKKKNTNDYKRFLRILTN